MIEAAGAAQRDVRRTALWLLSAEAVRERCAALTARIEDGRSEHFAFAPDALATVAERVAALTRRRFPDLSVPPHARWRHFEVGGIDRFASLAAARGWASAEDAARAMADLAIVSVLLDAGAGPRWRYHEAATGAVHGRSEGLALASLAMFASGAFSAVPADPLRADAAALADLTMEEMAAGFQIDDGNPLVGAEGRLSLLSRLAETARSRPDLFAVADDPRPGGIVDALAAAHGSSVEAPDVLAAVLDGLSPIWPGRKELAGVALGDTWHHGALGGDEPGDDLVPFHKLSTWLTLSLIEPLEVRGLKVTALDRLPALAEYRNGGLLVDGGVLVPRAPVSMAYPVDHPLVVEWRAATVTLVDRLAPLVRAELDVTDEGLPLPALLEGGTWLAGRELARSLRADGGPPIAVSSDGTVF